jgi:hypothetical protein
MSGKASKFARPEFAKPHAERDNWENASMNAVSERAVMVAEFHAWLVKTRIATERYALLNEANIREIGPFAQAGLANASTPRDVPFVVMEFAQQALNAMEFKRKLDLLNVYYRQASFAENTERLTIEPGNEAEVNQLWDWFIEERSEGGA